MIGKCDNLNCCARHNRAAHCMAMDKFVRKLAPGELRFQHKSGSSALAQRAMARGAAIDRITQKLGSVGLKYRTGDGASSAPTASRECHAA